MDSIGIVPRRPEPEPVATAHLDDKGPAALVAAVTAADDDVGSRRRRPRARPEEVIVARRGDDVDVDRASHWDGRYDGGYDALSWHQPEPRLSLRLLDLLGVETADPVIDVGGGASLLVDRLLERGHTNVTVLDVSIRALDAARGRLGSSAGLVRWVVADVTGWQPDQRYAVWHDRAVFHFLVDRTDRADYLDVVDRAVAEHGALIVATFAPDGPTHCSGLPVRRYDEGDLAAAFGPGWRPVAATREEHVTPTGAVQPFTWVALRRR